MAAFFQYQDATLVEAKKLIKEVSIDKTKTPAEALEELRATLVSCFQAVPPRQGRPLVIRMANSAADFSNTFSGDATFPLAVFDPVAWATEEVHGKIVRDEDKAKTANTFMPGADFRVIVTSSFSAGDAEGFLKGSLPLDKFELLHLVEGEPPPVWVPQHGAVVRCAVEGEGGTVLCTMLKWGADDGGESSVKFADGKIKLVASAAISEAPEGSVVPAAPAVAGPPTAAAADAEGATAGKKKAAVKKKKGGGKKKKKKKQ